MKPIDELKYQFKSDTVTDNIPFIIFCAILICLYIYNHHYADNTIRDIAKIKIELKELKWEYTSSKNELENKSIQTEVANLADKIGLRELVSPPSKIIVNINSNDN
jgi:hypothetical protein